MLKELFVLLFLVSTRRCIAPHRVALPRVASHRVASHRVALRRIARCFFVICVYLSVFRILFVEEVVYTDNLCRSLFLPSLQTISFVLVLFLLGATSRRVASRRLPRCSFSYVLQYLYFIQPIVMLHFLFFMFLLTPYLLIVFMSCYSLLSNLLVFYVFHIVNFL